MPSLVSTPTGYENAGGDVVSGSAPYEPALLTGNMLTRYNEDMIPFPLQNGERAAV